MNDNCSIHLLAKSREYGYSPPKLHTNISIIYFDKNKKIKNLYFNLLDIQLEKCHPLVYKEYFNIKNNLEWSPILCHITSIREKYTSPLMLLGIGNTITSEISNPTDIVDCFSNSLSCSKINKLERKLKILIAEDGYDARVILISRLKSSYDYEIIGVSNGADAITILKNQQIDIIITDLNMPLVDGYQLINLVKNSDEYKNIKIIVTSGYGGREDIVNTLKMGADFYVAYPCHYFEIIYAIEYCKIFIANTV